jgi:hypothetical protein
VDAKREVGTGLHGTAPPRPAVATGEGAYKGWIGHGTDQNGSVCGGLFNVARAPEFTSNGIELVMAVNIFLPSLCVSGITTSGSYFP